MLGLRSEILTCTACRCKWSLLFAPSAALTRCMVHHIVFTLKSLRLWVAIRPLDWSRTVIAATSLYQDDLLRIWLRVNDKLCIDLMTVPVFDSLLSLVNIDLCLVVTWLLQRNIAVRASRAQSVSRPNWLALWGDQEGVAWVAHTFDLCIAIFSLVVCISVVWRVDCRITDFVARSQSLLICLGILWF